MAIPLVEYPILENLIALEKLFEYIQISSFFM